MDLFLFKENEVDLIWNDSKNFLFKYNQNTRNFISNLSILDMFFNIGYKNSEELLKIKQDYWDVIYIKNSFSSQDFKS